MSSGSSWKKWDFHLHTPCSALNNQFGDPSSNVTWDKYVEKVEKKAEELEIAAIGVTDYFTIEGYKRLLEYQNNGRLENILLFPNIELRLDQVIYLGIGDTKPRRLNFHVLFSPELHPKEIEDHFLHDLKFVHEKEPFATGQKRRLREKDLIEFGNYLQEQHQDFRDRSPFEIGCMNAVVRTEDIQELLFENSIFKGNYLLVLPEENLSVLEWNSQHHAIRKHLIQMSHAILSSNKNTREFCLGKKHDSKDEFINEFKSYKPCIWGCDSHSFEERFLEPDDNRFCWIKADLTWEGLKQILYEPNARVKIQNNSPEPEKSIYTFDEIHIEQVAIKESLKFQEFQSKLSPNLIALIGGRGSGKTALLDVIASFFTEGEKLFALTNSFLYRIYREEFEPSARNPIHAQLKFKSGDEIEKSVGDDQHFFENANILYLTQNHFDEYSANPRKLNDHIVDLVFENFPDERIRFEHSEREITNIQNAIELKSVKIEQLINEIDGQLEIQLKQRKLTEGEIQDYTERIKEIEEKQGKSSENIIQLTESLSSIEAQYRAYIRLQEKHEGLARLIETYRMELSNDIDQINEDINELESGKNFVKIPLQRDVFNKLVESLGKNIKYLKRAIPGLEKSIFATKKEIEQLEGIDLKLAELRQRISELKFEIAEIESNIEIIESQQKKIDELEESRWSSYRKMIRKTNEQKHFLQKMIKEFEEGKDKMLKSLKFSAIIDTGDLEKFVETIAEMADNRSHSYANLKNQFLPIFQSLFKLMSEEYLEEDHIDNYYLSITDQLKAISKDTNLKKKTKLSDFHNALMERFFGIGLNIDFNGISMKSLSMGERAIVLLKVLLALDDKPLLIDQPEEHLDNRYIYDELVPAFRTAKTKRQIFIATHNANLVVNTDAEQIVLAEHVDGNISYTTGTLESLPIRESIKTILEGGDEAFQKREAKYGYIF